LDSELNVLAGVAGSSSEDEDQGEAEEGEGMSKTTGAEVGSGPANSDGHDGQEEKRKGEKGGALELPAKAIEKEDKKTKIEMGEGDADDL